MIILSTLLMDHCSQHLNALRNGENGESFETAEVSLMRIARKKYSKSPVILHKDHMEV